MSKKRKNCAGIGDQTHWQGCDCQVERMEHLKNLCRELMWSLDDLVRFGPNADYDYLVLLDQARAVLDQEKGDSNGKL